MTQAAGAILLLGLGTAATPAHAAQRFIVLP